MYSFTCTARWWVTQQWVKTVSEAPPLCRVGEILCKEHHLSTDCPLALSQVYELMIWPDQVSCFVPGFRCVIFTSTACTFRFLGGIRLTLYVTSSPSTGTYSPSMLKEKSGRAVKNFCFLKYFFGESETTFLSTETIPWVWKVILTLRYEQRCPPRHWRAGWSRDLVTERSSYTRLWTLDLSERALFCKQGQKSVKSLQKGRRLPQQSMLLEERRCTPSTNQRTRLTLSRCACVWSVTDSADLWAAAALFHLPKLGFFPSGRGRRGRETRWRSAAASPRATWGQGPPWRDEEDGRGVRKRRCSPGGPAPPERPLADVWRVARADRSRSVASLQVPSEGDLLLGDHREQWLGGGGVRGLSGGFRGDGLEWAILRVDTVSLGSF